MLIVPGTNVDRFVVIRLLGEGGLARVYLVKHRRLGSEHALKLLHVKGERAKQRFLQEGQVQARIRHPNLVPVTDVVELENEIGLVMDFVDGPALSEVLSGEGAISRHDVPTLFDQMCRGVTAAHGAGVLHRDLKPANVLLAVSEAGIVARISDFGIAKVVADFREGAPSLTEQGTFMGTLGYMAPEQLSDAKAVDVRADVFSLGCILYEMLAGRSPYVRRDRGATIRATLDGEHKPLGDATPGLPAALIAAVERAIHPLPGRRFDTVELLRAAVIVAAAPLLEEPGAEPLPAPPPPPPPPPVRPRNDGPREMIGATLQRAPPPPTLAPAAELPAPAPPTIAPPEPSPESSPPTIAPPAEPWTGTEKQASAVERGRLLDSTAAPLAETERPRAESAKPLLDFNRNRGPDVTAWLTGLVVVVSIAASGVLWLGYEQSERIVAADAQVAALATNLDRPWMLPPAPMAAAFRSSGTALNEPVERFRAAPTARTRIAEARALVRATRAEFARQASLSRTSEATLALSELEPIDATVVEAERALASAEALRTDWATAVAATVGWFDPKVPAASTPLPPAHPLPALITAPDATVPDSTPPLPLPPPRTPASRPPRG